MYTARRLASTLGRNIKLYNQVCARTQTTVSAENKDLKPWEKSPVWVCNEWDPLDEVIVGRPDNGFFPEMTTEFAVTVPDELHRPWLEQNAGKPFPKRITAKAHEEVEEFVRILEAEGVKVRRPEIIDHSKPYTTPHFTSKGFVASCPRDVLIAVCDEIIEATMSWKCRYFESFVYRPLLKEYFHGGAKWTAAPKPELSAQLFDEQFASLPVEERCRLSAEELRMVSTEFEPIFDAAEFMRAGKDVFVQKGHVTNRFGIEWMRRLLTEKGINLHVLEFGDDIPVHIDASLTFLKPGLVMMHPGKSLKQIDMFHKAGWKIVHPAPSVVTDFSEYPLWFTSNWLHMNMLNLDGNRIFVEAQEIPLQKQLTSLGMTPIPVKFRHAYSFEGGFHCWTCDVRRRGYLESYF